MALPTEPSYTDLVYEVLRSAEHPLAFQEIFDAVEQHRPITTRNPRATIRSALSQGSQLVRLDDGRYGYLPHCVRGSLLRVPLTEKKPANHPLIFPDDVRHALWPSFLESQKRRDDRPTIAQLPGGAEVTLALEFFGQGVWGSRTPEPLRRYLVDNFAAAGDSLLIRVIDGEAGRVEAWHEPRRKQNAAAVAHRQSRSSGAACGTTSRSGIWPFVCWPAGRTNPTSPRTLSRSFCALILALSTPGLICGCWLRR